MMKDWALYTPNAREICRRAGVFPPNRLGSTYQSFGAVAAPGTIGPGAEDAAVVLFPGDVQTKDVPYGVVKWDTFGEITHPETFEVIQAYDPDTGIFTVPYDGLYEFNATFNAYSPNQTSTSGYQLALQSHGIIYRLDFLIWEYSQGVTQGFHLGGSIFIYLVAFEEVKVRFTATTTVEADQGAYGGGVRFTGTYFGAAPEGSFVGDPDWF